MIVMRHVTTSISIRLATTHAMIVCHIVRSSPYSYYRIGTCKKKVYSTQKLSLQKNIIKIKNKT